MPQSATTNATIATAATLASTTTLATYAAPTVVDDGNNGANITLAIPAGVTETLVDVIDTGKDPTAMAPVKCHGS